MGGAEKADGDVGSGGVLAASMCTKSSSELRRSAALGDGAGDSYGVACRDENTTGDESDDER